jgi:hypothetical protein
VLILKFALLLQENEKKGKKKKKFEKLNIYKVGKL